MTIRALLLISPVLLACGTPHAPSTTDGITLLATAPPDALELRVQVIRWQCEIDYADDVNTGDLHVPIGRAVHLVITNNDHVEDLDLALAGPRVHLPRKVPVSITFRVDRAGSYRWDCPIQKPANPTPMNVTTPLVAETPQDFATYVADLRALGDGSTAADGARFFTSNGCNACHSVDGSPRVGASMANIWGTTVELESGQTRVVDDAFVRDSLIKPMEVIRKGFPPSMPSYEGHLRDNQIVALTRYIESLGAPPTPGGTAGDAGGAAGPAADASLPAVSVELGLDLRALPTHSSPEHVDMYVLSQGDRLRDAAPAGVDIEIRHVPGWGVLYAVFRAATLSDARAACKRVITAYMADPPRLPLLPSHGKAQSAVSITTPCHDGSPP
jgi:mono/diheme cytochrome c family protein